MRSVTIVEQLKGQIGERESSSSIVLKIARELGKCGDGYACC